MYIKSRAATTACHLSVGALSAFASWLLFHIFGNEAWRLFPAWVLLIAAIYYIINALVAFFWKRRSPGRMICPTLQGAIIVSGFSLAIFRLVFSFNGLLVIGLEGVGMVLVDFLLPVFFFLDWLLFTKKGYWRMVDPFYWLAFLVCYICGIILSAEFMNSGDVLQYPYAFLNFKVIGLELMLSWFALMSVLVLAMGYICVVVDFAMSGKLSKRIVLPRIKTIVIEEEIKAQPKVKKEAQFKVQSKGQTEVQPKAVGAKPKVAAKATGSKPKAEPKKSKKPVALLEAQARSVENKKKQANKSSGKSAGVAKTAEQTSRK